MVSVLFILFLGYICWRLFIVVWALLVQIFLFFVKIVCLCLVIMAIYFVIKNVKVEIPSTRTNQLSYAIPVPSKKGYVVSPYSNQGIIDVRGMAPDTVIKDPYSGNDIRVP